MRAHFSPAKPLGRAVAGASSATAIFNERLFEFAGEAKRRHGHDPSRDASPPRGSSSRQREPYKILFPIPATQIQSNPMLAQNPGY